MTGGHYGLRVVAIKLWCTGELPGRLLIIIQSRRLRAPDVLILYTCGMAQDGALDLNV